MPFFLPHLARAHAELGQFEAAWRCIGEAMTAAETTKEKWCEAEIHRTAGEIALMSPEPDPAKAQAHFERAIAIARAQKAKSWELRSAMSLARLRRNQGERQQARDVLAPIYGWFTEGFAIPEISISVASEALPVRASTEPWLTIPYAFQSREPFSSARATSSWACAAAAARLPQRVYGIEVWNKACISVAA